MILEPLRELLQLKKRLLWNLDFVDVQNIDDSLQRLEDHVIHWLFVLHHL